jgi:hypothetical protein
MIGGKITEVYRFPDCISIVVKDRPYNVEEFLVIDLVINNHPLRRGDSLWWQSGNAYWTPKDKSQEDVAIPRIGYTYRRETLWVKIVELCKQGICPDCGNVDMCMHDGEGRLWCPVCNGAYEVVREAQP